MKKFIIPLASVIAGAAVAASFIALRSNKASADLQNPPDELPSGYYYIDGDPENDVLYLVVDGKNIHFESSVGLREAFRIDALNLDERYRTNEEELEAQVDLTMEDWGKDNYEYRLTKYRLNNDCLVLFNYSEIGNDAYGQGLQYSEPTKTIYGWAGSFVLYEDGSASPDETRNDTDDSACGLDSAI